MHDTYIIKKEYGAGSRYRTRNPKVMRFESYQMALPLKLKSGELVDKRGGWIRPSTISIQIE